MIEAGYMGEGGRSELVYEDIYDALKIARIADMLLIGLFGVLAVLMWQV
jgi:adenosylcobinamide-phosphate synthase